MKYTVSSDKPVAKEYMAYFVALLYVVIPVIVVLEASRWNDMVKPHLGIFLGVDILLIMSLLAFKFMFAWYKHYTIEQTRKGIVIVLYGVLDFFGEDKETYTISEVTKVKKKGKKLIIYGDINLKERFTKSKMIKKLVLEDYNKDVLKLFKEKAKE